MRFFGDENIFNDDAGILDKFKNVLKWRLTGPSKNRDIVFGRCCRKLSYKLRITAVSVIQMSAIKYNVIYTCKISSEINWTLGYMTI